MNNKNITSFTFISFLYLVCCVHNVNAAEIRFVVVPSSIEGDTASIVEAYIDPEETAINAVEGVVGFLGSGVENVSSVIVETGDSVLDLWLTNPLYARDEKVVRFAGGSTEGFAEKGLLFRMRIFSKESDELTISWLSGGAYENNGEGTPVGISSRSLVLSLAKNEPNQINPASIDSSPPYFDTILVSQDPDVYDGKYFVSFRAIDDVSGIARYEVIEDQVVTEIRDGVYVLRDQERKSKVVVVAYDQAGNSTSIKVPTKYAGWYVVFVIGVVMAVMVLILYVFYQRRINK